MDAVHIVKTDYVFMTTLVAQHKILAVNQKTYVAK
jgi:hypothetical protein